MHCELNIKRAVKAGTSFELFPSVELKRAGPIHHYSPLHKKPQACPPPLTKSSQKAINILITPSAPTTKPPEGWTLCFFPPRCRLLLLLLPSQWFPWFHLLLPWWSAVVFQGAQGRPLWAERSPTLLQH